MNRPILAQIEAVYYPILSVFGIFANLVTIVILSRGKCGLSKCITRYLVAMAVADLMVLIFDVILDEIKGIYFPRSFLDYTPICSLNHTLILDAIDCSVWLTVAFTFDRFIAICYQKLRTKYCTDKTAAVIITTVCGLGILKNIPAYFINEAGEIIDNQQWFCVAQSTFYTLPIWMAYHWLYTILTPFVPFLLIVLLNALTIRHIILAGRVRRGLRGSKTGESQNDQEMENRRKSIILLVAISGSFLLLWMVNFLYEVCVKITDAQLFQTDYTDPFTIMEQTGYMLQRLSSCTNTVIYAVAQTKFRDELSNLIKYPFAQMMKLIQLY